VRLIELPDTIDLAFDAIELPDDERHEPLIAATAAATAAEPRRLDPKRIDFDPEPVAPKGGAWRGSIGSLLLHLLPLLALITWMRPPLDIPPPIPIQLVIEPPPPPPLPPQTEPKQPSPPKSPPPGLRASDDFGTAGEAEPSKGADPKPQPPADQTQTAAAAPEPSAEPAPQSEPALKPPDEPTDQPHLVAPPPEPPVEPIPALVAPPPDPSPQSEQIAALMPPPPAPKPAPVKPQATPRLLEQQGLILPLPLHPDRRREASASARYPGPRATRDEYCAYALKLTMSHVDLLPLSLLGARHGNTVVTIRLAQDGTVLNARVVQGSGYNDIDERVAQMVRAVGRFPPLPAWLPGPTADFTFRMHFPNPGER
jgi:TonB family protein